MAHGDASQKIRERAVARFIEPARHGGQVHFTIAIKLLMRELEAEGFAKNRPAQFCTAVQKESFRDEQGFVVERVDGPVKGKGPLAVLHCRFKTRPGSSTQLRVESPDERALRVTEKLRGRLQMVIQSFGGTEGYMAWVRREGA